MSHFARMAVLAALVWVGSARLCAGAALNSPELRTENRARELAHVFHPTVAAQELQQLLDPLGVLAQSVAAAIIIGALMLRMRKDDVQMENIASMMMKVAFIATVPLWKTWTLESAEAVASMLGGPSVPGATLVLEAAPDRGQLSPLLVKLWALGEQWSLEGSPMSDALAGNWVAGSGNDEQRIAEGWNWAKPPAMGAEGAAEISWAVETNSGRAEQLQFLVMGGAAVVHFAYIGHYLAETLRLLLFHAGCALAPFCIAGLGTQALQVQSVRALLGLLGVAFWPLPWAVGNVASVAMLEGALTVSQWTCSAAMYPKMADDAQRTLAMAAPYLSWWLLGMMLVVTACICLWLLGALVFGPWILHKLLSAGARWTGLRVV